LTITLNPLSITYYPLPHKMKGFFTIGLLILSNVFMTLAWYGHLKFKDLKWFENAGLITIVLISWGLALFEYFFQVPANRIGYEGNGGPFSLLQLKVIQEVITLVIFVVFSMLFFKTETFKWNHFVGMCLLVLAVYFIFRK
jgi:uncharacterized protein